MPCVLAGHPCARDRELVAISRALRRCAGASERRGTAGKGERAHRHHGELLAVSRRGKGKREREEGGRERGREGERERGREGERERGREGERKRGREEERKKGRKRGKRRKREGERNREKERDTRERERG